MNTYLGDNIADLRKRAGISQEEFADKLNVSRQAVSKWERNEGFPDTENLIAISKFFGVTMDDLINGDLSKEGEDISSASEKTEEQEIAPEGSEEVEIPEEAFVPSKNIKECKSISKGAKIGFWMSLPYPIIITIIYMIWGFLTPNGFQIGWTLYVTIPVYYTIFPTIKSKSIYVFCYPALVTFIFLLFGMMFNIWHPLWVIYLTVPLYYSLVPWLNRIIFKKY